MKFNYKDDFNHSSSDSTRLELSRAKHPSLTGHSRMAKRVVSLLRGYEFTKEQFFSSDGAPEAVAKTRESAFYQLADLLQT
eukprot:gene58197-77659_t